MLFAREFLNPFGKTTLWEGKAVQSVSTILSGTVAPCFFLLSLDIQFFSDHSINVLTISTELSCSFHTGEILVSSAYLNRMSLPFKLISRSLRKMVNKWGPLTLPCVVPLLTSFHCLTNPSYNSLCFLPSKKTQIPIGNVRTQT